MAINIKMQVADIIKQLELLVDQPNIAFLFALVFNSRNSISEKFDQFINTQDVINEFSCILLDEAIDYLYVGADIAKFKVTAQAYDYTKLEYPFVIRFDHYSHVSNIVAIDPEHHIYLDYYDETERKNRKEFPKRNFVFFNMQRKEFLNFVRQVHKPSVGFYHSFIGPMRELDGTLLTGSKYLKAVIIEEVRIFKFEPKTSVEFIQEIRLARKTVVAEVEDDYVHLDREKLNLEKKYPDLLRFNLLYNSMLYAARKTLKA